MKLICPSCSSDYEIADGMIGPSGRKVRCPACAHVWKASPEAKAPPTAPTVDDFADADVEQAAVTGVADNAEAEGVEKILEGGYPLEERPSAMGGFTEAMLSTVIKERLEKIAAGNDGATTVSSGPVQSGGGSKKRRIRLKMPGSGHEVFARAVKGAGGVALPVAVFMSLALILLAVPMRDLVVRWVPDLAGVYEAAGLSVNVRGIQFSTFTATRDTIAGIPIMEIEGSLTNVSDRSQSLAPLRMALLGDDGEELFAWVVQPSVEVLPPGETLPVSSELTAPPPNAAGMALRFMRPGEQLPGA